MNSGYISREALLAALQPEAENENRDHRAAAWQIIRIIQAQPAAPVISRAALYNKIAHECHYDSTHPLESYAKLFNALQEAPARAQWQPVNNPNFSPFDGSKPQKYICTHCHAESTAETEFCPRCGYLMTEL